MLPSIIVVVVILMIAGAVVTGKFPIPGQGKGYGPSETYVLSGSWSHVDNPRGVEFAWVINGGPTQKKVFTTPEGNHAEAVLYQHGTGGLRMWIRPVAQLGGHGIFACSIIRKTSDGRIDDIVDQDDGNEPDGADCEYDRGWWEKIVS
jgi:hypothetical protein